MIFHSASIISAKMLLIGFESKIHASIRDIFFCLLISRLILKRMFALLFLLGTILYSAHCAPCNWCLMVIFGTC